MTNPLDPILEAYGLSRDAFKVVRRTHLPTVEAEARKRVLGSTAFYGRSEAECHADLERAEEELADLIVLSMYASFELTVRAHVAAQSGLLAAAAAPVGLGPRLDEWFQAAATTRIRMDDVVDFFAGAIDEMTRAQVGQIREYRHWVAHGRDAARRVPSIDPAFAHRSLTKFLSDAGIV